LAQKLREAIEAHRFEHVGEVTASFGTTLSKQEESEDSLLKRVDSALYRAKESGRNRVCTSS